MIFLYVYQINRDPHAIDWGVPDSQVSSISLEKITERLERRVTSGDFSGIRAHIYEVLSDGQLAWVKTLEKTNIRALPRTINKRNDQHRPSIKEKAEKQHGELAQGVPNPGQPTSPHNHVLIAIECGAGLSDTYQGEPSS